MAIGFCQALRQLQGGDWPSGMQAVGSEI